MRAHNGRSRCPERFQSLFIAAWNSGVPTSVLRDYFLRLDGSPYNLRTIRGWASREGLGCDRIVVNSPNIDWDTVMEELLRTEVQPELDTDEEILEPTPEEAVQAAIEQEQIRLNTLDSKAEQRRLLREAAHLDQVVRCLREEMPRLSVGPVRKRAVSNDPSEESALAFISDVQLGERVDPVTTSGLGYYNLEAFIDRAERYYEAIVRLITMRRTATNVRDLHVLFGGDIVEGASIYPSQLFNIDILTVPQAIQAVKTFSEMLAAFASDIGLQIHVYGVPGNHGRIARKGQEPYMNNMDTLVYRMMEMYLEKHDGIKFHISDSWFQLFKIQGHLYAAEHGDAVRGSLGIPLYGLIRRHGRLVMMTGEIIEGLFIGHHHVPTSAETGFGCRAFINGSWVGTSDFSSHEMGLGSVPSQLLLGINRHHGIVWESNIYLADKEEIRQLPIVEAV